ncbi:MAG: HAD-IA family hydrolase [Gammaproteobacteria bacterium]|nr:HAD-IA family hydrolase [Gammaproteobacteria bacterium]
MNDYELIVFDWDGTLIDSEARIVNCMRAAIRDLQLPARSQDEMRNVIGLGLHEALSTLYPDDDHAMYAKLVERYRHHFLFEDATPSELFEGVEALLSELRDRGHFIAIATGKGRVGLDKALDETGLHAYFDYTRCADETRSKPHPQMLEEIMERLGMTPQQTIMIGDTEFDMQMANNAGTAALAVSYGVHEKQRLLACNPLACVDDVTAMHSWLIDNNSRKAQGIK